jgi:hypothetical protein
MKRISINRSFRINTVEHKYRNKRETALIKHWVLNQGVTLYNQLEQAEASNDSDITDPNAFRSESAWQITN